MHLLLGFLVYVLRIESFRLALVFQHVADGMTDDASAAHMDANGRKVFLITAVVCVVVIAMGYSLTRLFPDSVFGTIGGWMLFAAMQIGAL